MWPHNQVASQTYQGDSNPRHARSNTVAHLGIMVCKVSVASASSPIRDATLAPGALEQGCGATSRH